MWRLLQHILDSQNQFASGGLLLMLVGGIGVFLRELPRQVWLWVVAQTTMTITVKDDDVAFVWVKEWFAEQRFLERVRRVDLDTTLRGAEIALLPAPGRHWFWHAGRPFWVTMSRSEETKGYRQRRTESLAFRTLGRDRAFLQRFVAEIAACHGSKVSKGSYLYLYDDGWTCVEAYSPRWIGSVILKAGEKEHLLLDMERFRASRERYRHLGVPYHRGYLLYGPPGTGKTSLVSGLAAHFGMSIYVVNLIELNDRSLKRAMNEVPENSVILFEDIDCMKAGDKRPERWHQDADAIAAAAAEAARLGERMATASAVTLSGLLNVLDGFHAPENVVFVMTTNHVEALDPALLRPGRIDYRLFMGDAGDAQKMELYRRFFPDAADAQAREFVEAHAAETMAAFQGQLLALEQRYEERELAMAE